MDKNDSLEGRRRFPGPARCLYLHSGSREKPVLCVLLRFSRSLVSSFPGTRPSASALISAAKILYHLHLTCSYGIPLL